MQRFSSGLESKGDREASLQKMTGRLSREGRLVSVRPVPSFLPEHEVQDFPGGWDCVLPMPGARIPPWLGNKILHATTKT